MCYTTNNQVIHTTFAKCDHVPRLRTCMQIRFNEASTAAFGTNGYRAACNNIPFQEVLVINHNTAQRAWFKQKASTPSTFKLSSTNYYTAGLVFGLWTGYGAAHAGYDYLFGVCDSTTDLSPGLFFSGYTSMNGALCDKACNQWCGDYSSVLCTFEQMLVFLLMLGSRLRRMVLPACRIRLSATVFAC